MDKQTVNLESFVKFGQKAIRDYSYMMKYTFEEGENIGFIKTDTRWKADTKRTKLNYTPLLS